MRQLVESLWRLYNEKHSITKEQVQSMKTLTEEEKSYVLGLEKEINKNEKVNLPN